MLTSSVAKQIEFRFLEGPGAKQRKEVTRRRAETIPMPPWSQAQDSTGQHRTSTGPERAAVPPVWRQTLVGTQVLRGFGN